MKPRALGLALLGGLLFGGMPYVSTASATREVQATSVDASAARIAACREAATKKGDAKVDILFVIDTSMSLRDSDPFGKTVRDPARVRAMESVISMLRSASDDDGGQTVPVQIRVNFLDFGSRVRASFESLGWQEIQNFDASRLKDFGSKDDDPDTDYVGAIIEPGGVAEVLEAARGESDCQVVLWFTDGKFDFDGKTGVGPRSFPWLQAETNNGLVKDRATAELARKAGERILCEKGKSRERAVADELRSFNERDALTVIGIGLNTTTAQDNFSVLRRLLEDPTCGVLTPVGSVVEVSSADDLANAMRAALFTKGPVTAICDEEKLESGATIYIAEPVERADIFLRSREKVSEIQLVRLGKSGNTAITLFKNGSLTPTGVPAGISVTTRQLDDAPTFETTLIFDDPTEDWVGEWVLRACNDSGTGPAQLDADVVIRGCIAFDLAAGYEDLVVGRTDGIYLVLQRCGDDASRLATVSALSLSAELLVDGKRVQTSLKEGESLLRVPFVPTVASLVGATRKNVKLQVVELNASYEVLKGSRPVVLEWSKSNSVFDISLRLPPKTPYVELLGCGPILKSSRSAVCEFRAVASDAQGRVLTEGPEIEPLKSLGNVSYATGSSTTFPLLVKPGRPETFEYTFTLAGVRTNTENVNQAFEISFGYETDGEPRESGAFTGEFVVEPDFGITPDWGRAILFAFGGLLTAVLILIVARWLTARIQIPSDGMLWVGVVDLGHCDSESVRAAVKSQAIEIAAVPLNATGLGRRELAEIQSVGDCGLTLRARAGWRLFTELGFASASNSQFHVIGSNGLVSGSGKRDRLITGRTSLSLVGEWWLIVRGSVDVIAQTSDEIQTRLESLPGKLVFIATSPEPPKAYFDDLAFGVAGGVSAGLAAAAERVHRNPRTDETPDVPGPVSESIAPTI